MSSQQVFLNSLLDFSNMPNSKRTDYTKLSASQYNNYPLKEQNKSNTDRQITKHSENQLLGNNQKLLKSFNSLRQKLTHTNRQNILLKSNIQTVQKQLQQQREKQSHFMNQFQTLNKKLNTSEQQCQQYKLRLNSAKQSMVDNQAKNEQIEKNKILLHRLIEENKRLKEELKISMQLSIQQKLQLEQQLQTFTLKSVSDTKQLQQTQNQLYAKSNQFVRLENQLRKLKLLYDQQVFLKKQNSQTMILQRENRQLKLLAQQLSSKLKKEKNKKYQLETKLLQLQQKVRLFGTKTDVYQGQLQTAMKKISQVQKSNLQTQKYANQALNQKLSWEEKFLNSTVILEELISRVKRELIGDAVELAKTCEFKLNKLKNDQKIDINHKPLPKRSKSSSAKKLRSQSKRKSSNLNQNNQQEKFEEKKFISFSNTQNDQFCNSSTKKDDHSKTVLKQKPHSHISTNNNNLDEVKKKLFTDSQSTSINHLNGLSQRPTQNLNQLLINTTPKTQINLEAKIRKQRQLMERKLRQKILYHKIQDAPSQTVKNKLRQEYFNINSIDL